MPFYKDNFRETHFIARIYNFFITFYYETERLSIKKAAEMVVSAALHLFSQTSERSVSLPEDF